MVEPEKKVRFIIYSWEPLEGELPKDERLIIKPLQFENYWQAWREGDVLVYPQDYNGISLPVVEALASGLGVISTDIYPFNEYLPKELLFKPVEMYTTRAASRLMPTSAARINPSTIAALINRWAGLDISEFSRYGKTWAMKHSWEKLLPKYETFFNHL
jgi:glycosyltransferase involved in cell wall biosynthesis